MKHQTAREAQTTTKAATPELIKPEAHVDKLRELQEAVAARAFELFESRGCEHGEELADWLRAESEILQPLSIKVRDYKDRLDVEAEMPAFSAENIKISAEPRRLFISGRADLIEGEAVENTFSRELLGKEAFHLLDLPVEIDAERAEAIFTSGILMVTLPKLAAGEPSQAQASAV